MVACPPQCPASNTHTRPRGFTLLEISVVLALVMLVAGLVISVTLEGLVRAERDAAGELIEVGLLVASDEAMRRAEIVELVWIESGAPGSGASLVVRAHETVASDNDAPAPMTIGDASSAATFDEPEVRPYWRAPLPRGIALRTDDAADPEGFAPEPEQSDDFLAEPGRSVRIALALPDGRITARSELDASSGDAKNVVFEIDAGASSVRVRTLDPEADFVDPFDDQDPPVPAPDAGLGPEPGA